MTVPAANALDGAVNALPASGGNAQPVTAQPTRTASQALEDRIAARRKAADAGHLSLVQSTAEKATQAQRGPDGKFLPATGAQPEAKVLSPEVLDAEKKPDATAALKADLDQHKAELAAAKKHLSDYDEVSEIAIARIQRLEGENKAMRKALQAHGVSDDPRDVELARYRERDSAGRLAAERAQAEHEQRARAEQQRQAQGESAAFEGECRSVLSQFPALNPQTGGQEAVDFWRAVYRSNAALALAPTVAAAIAARTGTAQPPRTLPRSSSSGGAPVSFDPRDVADKWKARQRAL